MLAVLAVLASGCRAEPSATGKPPSRIVSINACADQLLLALANPGQIVALSRYARDISMSAYVARAARYQVIGGSAEEVLVRKPDLVLAGSFTRRVTRRRLHAFGIRIETLKPARTLEDVRTLIRKTAKLIGQPERGRRIVNEVDRAIAQLSRRARGLTALNFQRRGYVAGTGTLLDDLLARAGVKNGAVQLGIRRVGRTTLEHVIKLKPDVLIVGERMVRAQDQGSALLLHPVLAKVIPPERRIVIPSRFTICGGPQNIEALRLLDAAFARLGQGR